MGVPRSDRSADVSGSTLELQYAQTESGPSAQSAASSKPSSPGPSPRPTTSSRPSCSVLLCAGSRARSAARRPKRGSTRSLTCRSVRGPTSRVCAPSTRASGCRASSGRTARPRRAPEARHRPRALARCSKTSRRRCRWSRWMRWAWRARVRRQGASGRIARRARRGRSANARRRSSGCPQRVRRARLAMALAQV